MMNNTPNDRPCVICGMTIVPLTHESLCHECGDKLSEASRLNKICAQFSIDNPRSTLRENPHFMPAERAHKRATGSVHKLWACTPCGRVMPQLSESHTSLCCDAPISII